MKISDKSYDDKYYKEIFDKYHKFLCLVALKYVYRADYSEDIVQDVFISFFEKTKKGLKIDVGVLPYLKRATINQSLKMIRDNKIIVSDIETEIISELYEINGYEVEVNEDKIISKLLSIVETLPDQCKSVFKQIVFEKKRYKDVAESLNISLNSVKTQYSRATRKIKDTNKILYSILTIMSYI